MPTDCQPIRNQRRIARSRTWQPRAQAPAAVSAASERRRATHQRHRWRVLPTVENADVPCRKEPLERVHICRRRRSSAPPFPPAGVEPATPHKRGAPAAGIREGASARSIDCSAVARLPGSITVTVTVHATHHNKPRHHRSTRGRLSALGRATNFGRVCQGLQANMLRSPLLGRTAVGVCLS